MTQAGALLGTAAYMSPEQCRGASVDARSDLYVLGCVLYEALSGRTPFEAPDITGVIGQHLQSAPAPLSEHRADCPPALDAFILRLLAKRPSDRPDSATAAMDALPTDRHA